jgi:hypothetical protein
MNFPYPSPKHQRMWDTSIVERLTLHFLPMDQYPPAVAALVLFLVTIATAFWFWTREDERAVPYSVDVPHQCAPGWNGELLDEPSLKACKLLPLIHPNSLTFSLDSGTRLEPHPMLLPCQWQTSRGGQSCKSRCYRQVNCKSTRSSG